MMNRFARRVLSNGPLQVSNVGGTRQFAKGYMLVAWYDLERSHGALKAGGRRLALRPAYLVT